MKTIILTLLICLTTSALFAQMHFLVPVEEVDSIASKDSSVFQMHPILLSIDVNENTFDTYLIGAKTIFYSDISRSSFYKSKNTASDAVLELPKSVFNLKACINPDKTYIVDSLNKVLVIWGLKYREPTTTTP